MQKLKRFLELKYSEVFDYLHKIKGFIFLIMGIFFIFFGLGFFIDLPLAIQESLLEYLKKLILETEGFSLREMILFLFSNNSLASFFGLVLGVIFGIFPLLSSVSNGFVVGFVSNLSVAEFGHFSLLALVPHGIFELPALFISLGMGVKLGFSFFYKNGRRNFRELFNKSIWTYLLLVLPLLFIAAIIEGLLIILL